MSLINREFLGTRNRIVPADGRQTITWTLKRDTDTDVTIANCEKRPVSAKSDRFDGSEIPTDGFVVAMSRGDMLTPLDDAGLSTSLVPEVGDQFTLADGTVCEIDDIDRGLMESRHKCLCRPHRTIA